MEILQIANNKYSIAHKTEHVRLGTQKNIQNSTTKIGVQKIQLLTQECERTQVMCVNPLPLTIPPPLTLPLTLPPILTTTLRLHSEC